MKVLATKVVDGKIEVGDQLTDGSTVAVIALETDESELSSEDELELADALAQIRAGHFVDGDQFLADLRARRKP